MTDKLPDHAEIEKYVHDLPKGILDRLPDCTASRRAKQLVDTVYEYAKEAREQAPHPPALSVQDNGRLLWGQDDETQIGSAFPGLSVRVTSYVPPRTPYATSGD